MRWYFDYISPYAYLQSTQLKQLDSIEPVTCTPVLFAGLLNHWENKGPAEIAPKRKWTFREIAWLADCDNIDLNFPSTHPFNPLPLLRLGIVHDNQIDVVQRLFRFVWAEGNVPQDEAAFSALLDELGTDASALQGDDLKKKLLANGELAVKQGVFGVPSLKIDNELFWGYNATLMATSYLTKYKSYPHEKIKRADSLPEGTGRTVKTKDQQPPGGSSARAVTAGRNTHKEPRIPLKPVDLAEPADLVAAIRKRRGGQLLELDRLLLYSRPLSEGWNHFLGNVREHFSVPQQLRELAMCTVAVLNNAEYEFSQHAPLYIKAGGSEEKATLLRQPDEACDNSAFTREEQLTIALTTQLTRDVRISDELFNLAQKKFGNEHLVEIVATIAAYNMVSRFLVAFELHPQ